MTRKTPNGGLEDELSKTLVMHDTDKGEGYSYLIYFIKRIKGAGGPPALHFHSRIFQYHRNDLIRCVNEFKWKIRGQHARSLSGACRWIPAKRLWIMATRFV